jgi:hypothetical protein
MWRLLRKTNSSSRQRRDSVSKRINGLGTKKICSWVLTGPQNQEWLCWRGPAPIYWTWTWPVWRITLCQLWVTLSLILTVWCDSKLRMSWDKHKLNKQSKWLGDKFNENALPEQAFSSPPDTLESNSRFSHILNAEGGRTVVMWSLSSRKASTHGWETKVGKAIIRLRAQ